MAARVFATAATVLVLAGCLSQPAPPTNYYVLEFDASVSGAPDSGPAETGPQVVAQDAEVAPMFDRRQLLQRLDGPLVRYRNGDLWAVSPSTAVADLVREGLTLSGRFTDVTSGRDAAGRYETVTRIDALTHHCCDTAPEAEVSGELVLFDRRSGEVRARHDFARREALSDSEPRSFVEAVARILSEEVVAFLATFPPELET